MRGMLRGFFGGGACGLLGGATSVGWEPRVLDGTTNSGLSPHPGALLRPSPTRGGCCTGREDLRISLFSPAGRSAGRMRGDEGVVRHSLSLGLPLIRPLGPQSPRWGEERSPMALCAGCFAGRRGLFPVRWGPAGAVELDYLPAVEGDGLGAAVSRIWRHSFSRRSNWAWEIGWAGMGDPFTGVCNGDVCTAICATGENADGAGRFHPGFGMTDEKSRM